MALINNWDPKAINNSITTLLQSPHTLEKVGRDIPRADARRPGELLNQLSPQQIADAFRAAGYSPEQVAAYSKKVDDRIAEISEL